MDPVVALLVLLGLVAVSSVVGVAWRRSSGAIRAQSGEIVVRPADVGDAGPFGARGTLLQFSTEICAFCPATRRLLSSLADRHDGIAHVDVDLTHAPGIARRFDVLQTPTTLVLDGAGAVRARIGGPPHPRELSEQLTRLLGDHDDNE